MPVAIPAAPQHRPPAAAPGPAGWRRQVPCLTDGTVTLREITPADAAALRRHLRDPLVLRHVTPGPMSIAGLQHFARWAQQQRRRGTLICFAIVAPGYTRPVGIMQLWPLDPTGAAAEWGVLLARKFWGTGLFPAAARLLFRFAFTRLRVVRLEARTTVLNRRANAAFRKIGARPDGRLLRGLPRGRGWTDAFLWSMPADTFLRQDAGTRS